MLKGRRKYRTGRKKMLKKLLIKIQKNRTQKKT